jgi:D-alanyl-D-alanine-carboxypeptidase/D-alanyl-D-alanine-endopeptidase
MLVGFFNLPGAIHRCLRIGQRILSTAPVSEQGRSLPVQTALFYLSDLAYLIVWIVFVLSPWLTETQIADILSLSGLLVLLGFAASTLARRMGHHRLVLPIPKQTESSNSNSIQWRKLRVPSPWTVGEPTRLQAWIDDIGWGAVRQRKAMLLTIGVLYKQQEMVASYCSEAMMRHTARERVVYEIGSVTKVFTTALLSDMVCRGEVDLHTPISSIVSHEAADRLPNLTLYQLATHTAGLPRFDPCYLLLTQWLSGNTNPYRHYSPERLLRYLHRQRNLHASDKGRYSNIGMDLLSLVLAARLGRTFEECLVDRICAPLGLSDTRITLSPDQLRRLVNGHQPDGRVASNWDTQLGGAGGLKSSVADLLRFLCANLGYGPERLVHVLQKCHQPREKMASGHRIGLGWMVSDEGFVWHNGMTGGYASFIGFHPRHHAGVVVLSNYAVSVDAIAVAILKHLTSPE